MSLGLDGFTFTSLAIVPLDPSTIFAATPDSGVYKSNDSGAYWTKKKVYQSSLPIFFTSFKDRTSGFIAIKRKIFDNCRLKGDYGVYFLYLMHYVIK